MEDAREVFRVEKEGHRTMRSERGQTNAAPRGRLGRVREAWHTMMLDPGMPYAEYPFKPSK